MLATRAARAVGAPGGDAGSGNGRRGVRCDPRADRRRAHLRVSAETTVHLHRSGEPVYVFMFICMEELGTT